MDSWRAAIEHLEGLLRPIATRPVDITDPAWLTTLRRRDNPLDEAGVRHETRRLLLDIIDWYPTTTDAERADLRALVARHDSFAWAATFLFPFATADPAAVRQQLILFSILDQGRDSRDAMLWLRAFTAQARAAGIDVRGLLHEVAAVSSAVDRYGAGSTQTMLLQAAARE
jgi:hypothetical protein